MVDVTFRLIWYRLGESWTNFADKCDGFLEWCEHFSFDRVDILDMLFLGWLFLAFVIVGAINLYLKFFGIKKTKLNSLDTANGSVLSNAFEGCTEEPCQWLNSILNWVYLHSENTPGFLDSWLKSLNEHARKLQLGQVQVKFERFLPGSLPPKLSQITTDSISQESITLKAQMLIEDMSFLVSVLQHHGQGIKVANCDVTIVKLIGQINVLSHYYNSEILTATGSFLMPPEIQLSVKARNNATVDLESLEQVVKTAVSSSCCKLDLTGRGNYQSNEFSQEKSELYNSANNGCRSFFTKEKQSRKDFQNIDNYDQVFDFSNSFNSSLTPEASRKISTHSMSDAEELEGTTSDTSKKKSLLSSFRRSVTPDPPHKTEIEKTRKKSIFSSFRKKNNSDSAKETSNNSAGKVGLPDDQRKKSTSSLNRSTTPELGQGSPEIQRKKSNALCVPYSPEFEQVTSDGQRRKSVVSLGRTGTENGKKSTSSFHDNHDSDLYNSPNKQEKKYSVGDEKTFKDVSIGVTKKDAYIESKSASSKANPMDTEDLTENEEYELNKDNRKSFFKRKNARGSTRRSDIHKPEKSPLIESFIKSTQEDYTRNSFIKDSSPAPVVSMEEDFLPTFRKNSTKNSYQLPAQSNDNLLKDRRLLVKVIKANGLGDKEHCFMDPYCSAFIDEPSQKHVTTAVKSTNNPFWDEHFLFDLNEHTENIKFEVFDREKPQGDSFLGRASIPVEDLRRMPSSRQIIPLGGKAGCSGTITVEFLFMELAETNGQSQNTTTSKDAALTPRRRIETNVKQSPSGTIITTTTTTTEKPRDMQVESSYYEKPFTVEKSEVNPLMTAPIPEPYTSFSSTDCSSFNTEFSAVVHPAENELSYETELIEPQENEIISQSGTSLLAHRTGMGESPMIRLQQPTVPSELFAKEVIDRDFEPEAPQVPSVSVARLGSLNKTYTLMPETKMQISVKRQTKQYTEDGYDENPENVDIPVENIDIPLENIDNQIEYQNNTIESVDIPQENENKDTIRIEYSSNGKGRKISNEPINTPSITNDTEKEMKRSSRFDKFRNGFKPNEHKPDVKPMEYKGDPVPAQETAEISVNSAENKDAKKKGFGSTLRNRFRRSSKADKKRSQSADRAGALRDPNLLTPEYSGAKTTGTDITRYNSQQVINRPEEDSNSLYNSRQASFDIEDDLEVAAVPGQTGTLQKTRSRSISKSISRLFKGKKKDAKREDYPPSSRESSVSRMSYRNTMDNASVGGASTRMSRYDREQAYSSNYHEGPLMVRGSVRDQ